MGGSCAVNGALLFPRRCVCMALCPGVSFGYLVTREYNSEIYLGNITREETAEEVGSSSGGGGTEMLDGGDHYPSRSSVAHTQGCTGLLGEQEYELVRVFSG